MTVSTGSRTGTCGYENISRCLTHAHFLLSLFPSLPSVSSSSPSKLLAWNDVSQHMISKPPRAMVRVELARGGDVRFEVSPLPSTAEGGGGGEGGEKGEGSRQPGACVRRPRK